MSRSCYVLELSVEPGGARRGDLFVYSSLDDVRRVLEAEFLSDDPQAVDLAASLALWYGETIALWVVQRGRLVDVVDLHTFLTVRVGDRPPTRLDDTAALDAIGEEISRSAHEPTYQFALDWDELARRVPALERPRLQKNEHVFFELDRDVAEGLSTHLEITDSLHYGYEDAENGGQQPPYEIPDPGDRDWSAFDPVDDEDDDDDNDDDDDDDDDNDDDDDDLDDDDDEHDEDEDDGAPR